MKSEGYYRRCTANQWSARPDFCCRMPECIEAALALMQGIAVHSNTVRGRNGDEHCGNRWCQSRSPE